MVNFRGRKTCQAFRVRCRDQVLGIVHPNVGDTGDAYPHLLVRDDQQWEWLSDQGRYGSDEENFDFDVVEVLGELVLADR